MFYFEQNKLLLRLYWFFRSGVWYGKVHNTNHNKFLENKFRNLPSNVINKKFTSLRMLSIQIK